MELAALFLLVTVALATAWLGSRPLALALFAAALLAALAIFLHHATDVLNLSF